MFQGANGYTQLCGDEVASPVQLALRCPRERSCYPLSRPGQWFREGMPGLDRHWTHHFCNLVLRTSLALVIQEPYGGVEGKFV